MAKAPLEIKSLARAHTKNALAVLAGVMGDQGAPHSARVQAATALLDRGWGKPTQLLGGDPDNPLKVERIEREVVYPANTDRSGIPTTH